MPCRHKDCSDCLVWILTLQSFNSTFEINYLAPTSMRRATAAIATYWVFHIFRDCYHVGHAWRCQWKLNTQAIIKHNNTLAMKDLLLARSRSNAKFQPMLPGRFAHSHRGPTLILRHGCRLASHAPSKYLCTFVILPSTKIFDYLLNDYFITLRTLLPLQKHKLWKLLLVF